MSNWVDDNFPCEKCQFREDNNGICMKRGICQMWSEYTNEGLRRLRLYELCAPIPRCIYSNHDSCLMKEQTNISLCRGITSDIMKCDL